MENIEKPKKKMTMKRRESLVGMGFILPWLIGFITLTIYPLLQSFWLSFNEATFYKGSYKTNFIFLDNFIYAFTGDEIFPAIVLEYFQSIIVNVVFVISVALFLAMLLNRKLKFRGMWRVIFFLPVVIISGTIMEQLTKQGATSLPGLSDVPVVDFISNNLPSIISFPVLTLFDDIILMLWFTGVPILIFLAALQRIDKSVYEASSIDGASNWQNFWKITLPSVKGFLFVNIVYTIVSVSFFDEIRGATENPTILAYMKQQAYNVDGRGFGYACAIGIIFLLFIVAQIGVYAFLVLRERKVKRTYGK